MTASQHLIAAALLLPSLALANPYGQPDPTLDAEERMNFRLGQALFERLWVSAPSSTQAADGLGPLYSARACASCHQHNGRGAPPEPNAKHAISFTLRLSIPSKDTDGDGYQRNTPDPVYGHQLQEFAVRGLDAEGRIGLDYEEQTVTFADGETITLRRPAYRIDDLAYGPLHPEVRLSPRIAPALIGLGLLESIPESVILAMADPDDQDGDGISGRANRVRDPADGALKLGRFGWKGGNATVAAQTQAAFATDIGLAVPFHPSGEGDCTAAQTACVAAPHGTSPQFDNLEADAQVTGLTAFYAAHIAPPAPREADHPEVRAGRTLFAQLGCAACHTPSQTTADGRTLEPYSDLLLHDLGAELADPAGDGLASGSEWRTAPLWGIGRNAEVNGHAVYLHDGRARTLLEAILWHGGEAEKARARVVALTADERAALIRFLQSL